MSESCGETFCLRTNGFTKLSILYARRTFSGGDELLPHYIHRSKQMYVTVIEGVGRMSENNNVRYVKHNEQCSGIFIPHVGPHAKEIFAVLPLHESVVFG